MWQRAREALSMFSVTLTGLETVHAISVRLEKPKESLQLVKLLVLGLIEGYQGKLAATRLEKVFSWLQDDLRAADGIPSQDLVDKLRNAMAAL